MNTNETTTENGNPPSGVYTVGTPTRHWVSFSKEPGETWGRVLCGAQILENVRVKRWGVTATRRRGLYGRPTTLNACDGEPNCQRCRDWLELDD